jgi:hypothetical protein
LLFAPDASTADNFATFRFEASEPGATFECRIDGEAFEECVNPAQYTELLPGEHTFEVRAVDLALNPDPTPASHAWTVEGPPAPNTTIQTGPPSETTNLMATFTFFATDAEADFECKLDDGAWESCSSPEEYQELLAGDHVLLVRATDQNGNVEEEPARYEWTIIGPPETTLDSSPEAEADSSTASFSFSASESDATFECRVDFVAFTACTSPKIYRNLADGDHTFEVRAVGANGMRDETPAIHEWTVAAGPETTINFGPGAVSGSTANFAFSANEFGATFECSIDGAGFTECLSPHRLTGLSAGPHEFQVHAIDIEGNADATPATYNWTVDLTPPQTSITDVSAGSIVFSFESSETGSSFECKVDAGAFEPCTSPRRYENVADGSHNFQVRAVDQAGNVDQSPASHDWTVDTTAPETTIGAGAPAATTTDTSANFSFSGSETGATFDCSLDGAAYAGCSSPKAYTGLAAGPHEFRVRARDAGGNVDTTPATHSWTVQALSCGQPVTAGANADSWIDRASTSQNKGSDSVLKVMSKGPSHDVRALVRFAMPNVPAGCVVKTAKLRLNSPSYKDGRTLQALRVTGAWSEGGVTWDNQPATTGTPATVASGTGYREWDVKDQVRAMYSSGAQNGFLIRDAAEGQDSEQQFTSREGGTNPPQLVVTFGAPDTTAPDTTVDSGPDPNTASSSARFTFSSNEQNVTFECSLDSGAFTSCASPKDYTNVAVGQHELRVRSKDDEGNVDGSPATYGWTVLPDTTAPDTTIGSAPAATVQSSTASFGFSANEQGSSFECSLDGAAYVACTTPKEYTFLAVGAHSFRVRAIDGAGNVDASPASHFWTVEAASCGAAKTAAADRDAWVLQSSSSSNFGSDSVLKVDSKSGGNARALVRFALPTIPSGCQVTSATLRLYSGSYKENRTLQAFRLGATWSELSVNWSTQPATTGTAATAPSRNSAGYVEWTVTSQVQGMYTGTNAGFLIRDASESGGGLEQAFNSREKGTDNPPQLVITFG